MNLGRLISNIATLGSIPRRRRIPGSSNGRMRGSDPRDAGSSPAPGSIHTPTLTVARILRMGRAGTLHVDPLAFIDVMTEGAGLRRYASMSDTGNTFVGPHGSITVEMDVALAPGEHRWTDGGPSSVGVVQRCSYCGAPGQRVGARCEYCQVAVSR